MEEQILLAVNKEYQATNVIAKKAGINWYKTEYLLEKLLQKGLVEKLRLGKGIFWRKK